MKTLTDYAKSFIGIPYIFGGEHPSFGYDCSGLVQHILQSVGADPAGDQTALTLFHHFSEFGRVSEPKAGALSFYGVNTGAITHVGFLINEYQMVEAGGGNHMTTDINTAIRRGAFVRIRPYDFRKDLVAVLMPNYPTWVQNV
jgi:cell wall-associated NlpC family hydrolase